MPARVFIEGTTTYVQREVGGIHRVVRKVVEHTKALHGEFDIASAPTVLRGGRLCDASSLISNSASGKPGRQFSAAVVPSRTSRIRRARRPVVQDSSGGFPDFETRANAPAPVNAIAGAWDWAAKRLLPRDVIAWRDADLLLLLDSSWGKRIWPAVRKAKERGVAVGVMVHDLIPIHYPQFFPAKIPPMFRKWLDEAIEHADFFVGNSQTTIRELQQYVRQVCTAGKWSGSRFDSFWLGADLPSTDHGAPLRESVRSFFTEATRPYLAVGTLEPRKNHSYLLDAFDRIWQKSPETRLCIAGKIGWQCDQVVTRIRKHPQFGKSLILFSDLSDAELQFCYQNANAFIFPSVVEGFGLPIVEALNHGLRVLASDTPIHREIGKNHCRYFDLDNVNSLFAMIREIERGTLHAVSARQPIRIVTWEESCRELLTKSLRMAEAAKPNWGCRRRRSSELRAAA